MGTEPRPSLGRRLTAEALGTGLLVAVVIGSGIAAERLSADAGLQLLENSLATAGGIAALILALGPVSGGHFNPLVSVADRVMGGLGTTEMAAYAGAQVFGAAAGAVVANLMFDLDAVAWSTTARGGAGLRMAEVVATFGLVLVVLGVARSARPAAAPFAVAGYLAAAYWFTSSTSFANPAVTLGRTLSDTFAGIDPVSVPAFVAAQVAGAALAITLARYLFHPGVALDVVVPTEGDGRPER